MPRDTYENVFILNDKVTEKLNKMTKAFDPLDKKLSATEKKFEAFSRKVEHITKVGDKLKGVGKSMTVGVTLPIIALGGAAVKAAADMESMQQQLSTMLGSEIEGAKKFNEIKEMAAKTPFGTKDLMQATNTMLGFGIQQEKVIPLMKQLGDISGGNAERFQSLALAFSQVSSAGKLQGQDLMQMINAGFNPLEAISKRTGKSIGVLKEEMSKGKITVQMVEQAMKDATSEGGRFFGMMEKQSQTALGQWSTFQDELNSVLAEFGQIILPYAIKALQKMSEILQKINNLSPEMKKIIVILAGVAAAIGPVLMMLGSIISSLNVILPALAVLKTAGVAAMAALKVGSLGFLGSLALVAASIAGIIAGLKAAMSLMKAMEQWKEADERLKVNNLQSSVMDEKTMAVYRQKRKELGDREFKNQYGKLAEDFIVAEKKNKKGWFGGNTTNNTTNNVNNTTNNHYATVPTKMKNVAI